MNAPISKIESRHTGVANVMTNVWLIVLALIIGGTVLITSVLVGWPIIAHLAAKFTG